MRNNKNWGNNRRNQQTQLNRNVVTAGSETVLNTNLNGNSTVLNSSLNSNGTVLNNEISDNSTVLNHQIAVSTTIEIGTVLFDKYKIVDKLDVTTGEADLYLCSCNDTTYVAKIYRRKMAIKPEVTKKLKEIDSPYIAKLYDTGEVNGFPVEILPYYRLGSLQGKKFTYEQLKEYIIPALNEGLKILHDRGIVHKDLKPSNIMIADNHKDVAIIDFGISSVHEGNNTVIVTQTGMTPVYSAPEAYKNLFLAISDYYSLGITVYELFYGYTPYDESFNRDAIEQYTSIQRTPFPAGSTIPEDLKDFIYGTTYNDITNRNNKKNPNRRWGYEEVKKWCEGIKQPIPGMGIGNVDGDMRPYTFLGKKYTEKEALVRALVENWKDGKKQLFRGLLSGFFKSFDPEIAGFCIDAEEEATRINGKDDFIFWKTMYKLNKSTKEFYWKGRIYQGLPALGRDLLEHLWKGDNSLNPYVDDVLENKMLSEYIKLMEAKNEKLIQLTSSIESAYKFSRKNTRDREMLYYRMAYMLSGQKLMHADGRDFRTIGELTSYMKELLNESYEAFEKFSHTLIDYDDNLDPQFESWLMALGKEKELEQWRHDLTL